MNRLFSRVLSLAAAVLLLCAFTACGAAQSADTSNFEEAASVSAPAEELPEPEERMSYPGFTGRVLSEKNSTLTLPNDAENSVDLVFSITDSEGKALYTSDPVAPGESVRWDALHAGLGSGKQTVTISVTPVRADGTELSTVTQTITLKLPGSKK